MRVKLLRLHAFLLCFILRLTSPVINLHIKYAIFDKKSAFYLVFTNVWFYINVRTRILVDSIILICLAFIAFLLNSYHKEK